jgi:hypothetical protein
MAIEIKNPNDWYEHKDSLRKLVDSLPWELKRDASKLIINLDKLMFRLVDAETKLSQQPKKVAFMEEVKKARSDFEAGVKHLNSMLTLAKLSI